LNLFPAPNQGSSPNLIFFALPIFQVIQLETGENYSIKYFQTKEPLEDFEGEQNQSAIERLEKYLDWITLYQREFPCVKHQIFHPAST